MGYRCRFVQPEIVRLYLAENADYIDVKKELTAGEQRHIFSGIVKAMHLGEKTTLDPDQVGKNQTGGIHRRLVLPGRGRAARTRQ